MSANTFTYDLKGGLHSTKTADFDGKDGKGNLLSPFYIGPANYAVLTNENQDSVGQKYAQEFQSSLPQKITEEFAKQGFNVIGVSVLDISYAWAIQKTGTWWTPPIVAHDLASCSLALTWTVRVTLDKSLSMSPFPPWAFKLIEIVAVAIIGALIAYWSIQALKDMWESMTTDTTTVIEYNPDGTIKSKETKKTPDPFGITSVAVGIGIVLAVGVGLYLLIGHSKERKSTSGRR